jgi:threonine aldolase
MIARHYMDGFVERLQSAVEVSEAFYRGIGAHPRVTVERIPRGTNLTRLTLKGVDAAAVARRLAERGIRMGSASSAGVVTLGVNETWTRTTARDLVTAFDQALG